jgi:hypothetical protein
VVLVVGSPGTLRFAAPVSVGLRFRAGTQSGLTTTGGNFTMVVGERVSFSIGDLLLGSTLGDRCCITLTELVGGNLEDPAIVNRARLLYSLDAAPAEAAVTIPSGVDAAAVLGNPEMAGLITQLDFADDAAFDAVAPNILAVLTRDYPFTAVLLDRTTARERLSADLGSP